MKPETASLVVAVAAAIFAASQVLVARRQGHLIELQVLHELRDQWLALRAEWLGLLMIGGQFYVKPDAEAVSRHPILAEAAIREYVEAAHFDKMDRRMSRPEVEDQPSDDRVTRPKPPLAAQSFQEELSGGALSESISILNERQEALLEPMGNESPQWPEAFYREPLGLLSVVCSYVLQGRLSARLAYDILGEDLIRNSASVRYAIDVSPQVTYYLRNHPGIRRRVLLLLDVLWAEAALRGDLSEREAATARATKAAYRSGVRNRRRLRREARRLGGLLRMAALDWLLTAAEVDARAPVFFRTGVRVRVWFLGWYFTFTPAEFPSYDYWTDAERTPLV